MGFLEIRKYEEADIDGFYEAVIESKNEISEWLPWCSEQYTIRDTKEWIKELVPKIWESKKGCEFIIVNLEKKKVIGGCCLEQIDEMNKEASIGYWIRTSESNKGLATIASKFLLKYGFEELKLNSIKVIPSEENKASIRVAQKLPYSEVKKVKDGFKIRNKVSNALIYTITKKSYNEKI